MKQKLYFFTFILLNLNNHIHSASLSLEEQILDQRRKLFEEELRGISKRDSSYEKRASLVEEKMHEFTYNLTSKSCPSNNPKDQIICSRTEADMAVKKEYSICRIKAQQIWYQSSLTDDYFQNYPDFFSKDDLEEKRNKIWMESKDCSKVLVEEQKYLAQVLESLKEGGNFLPETCKWVTDLPRKVINIPGCPDKDGKTKQNNMCTGYVVCDQKDKFGSGKFVRMATCRKQFCLDGDEQAKNCVAQKNYSSEVPKDLERESVSDFLMNELVE